MVAIVMLLGHALAGTTTGHSRVANSYLVETAGRVGASKP